MADSGSLASRVLSETSTQSVRQGRASTGTILTLTRVNITITWATAFADTNYTVACTIEDTSVLGLGLLTERITAKTAASITVQIFNQSVGSLTGMLHAIAIHD